MLRQRRADLRRQFCAVIIVLLSCSVFATPAICDHELVPTNLDLMTGMTSEIAGELYDQFAAELGGRGVKLKPFANDERYQFLSNIFMSILSDRGLKVYQSNATGDLFTVEYQAITFDLSYPRVYRSWLFFGGKRVERRTGVTILATVYDQATGSVVWVGQGTRETVDEFAHGDVDRIEEGTFEFARPGLPTSGWSKLVEPIFVSGIVVGLIYLFFSNQNSDSS